jgi:hypothetical protein
MKVNEAVEAVEVTQEAMWEAFAAVNSAPSKRRRIDEEIARLQAERASVDQAEKDGLALIQRVRDAATS